MDKGTGVGWRSALMAPACFVIRSGVKRRRGGNGGWSDDGRRENRPDRQTKASASERKKRNTEKDEIRGQLRENWRV